MTGVSWFLGSGQSDRPSNNTKSQSKLYCWNYEQIIVRFSDVFRLSAFFALLFGLLHVRSGNTEAFVELELAI